LDVSQAPEAQQLGDENTRLRKLMADLSLDKEALQSVSRKKWVELVALKAAETGSALLVRCPKPQTRNRKLSYDLVKDFVVSYSVDVNSGWEYFVSLPLSPH